MLSARKQNTHSLLEVHLCHLTLQGRKARIQFRVCSSTERPPDHPKIPHYCAESLLSWLELWASSYGPIKASVGDQARLSRRRTLAQGWAGQNVAMGPVPAYLTIHSCGVAPCRPCLPSGRPSLDPSGTGGEAQGVVAEWAPGPLQLSRRLPHPAAEEQCPQGASTLPEALCQAHRAV